VDFFFLVVEVSGLACDESEEALSSLVFFFFFFLVVVSDCVSDCEDADCGLGAALTIALVAISSKARNTARCEDRRKLLLLLFMVSFSPSRGMPGCRLSSDERALGWARGLGSVADFRRRNGPHLGEEWRESQAGEGTAGEGTGT